MAPVLGFAVPGAALLPGWPTVAPPVVMGELAASEPPAGSLPAWLVSLSGN